jgi:Ca-activated chloride channel family protein
VRILSSSFLVLFAAAVVLLAQEQDPFRVTVDVDLVTLDVGVTDSSGKAIITLTRNDFEIYEDGRRQEIRSFAAVDTPYNTLMLFDCSGSTAPSWPFLIEAVNRFTGSLRPQDSMAMAQFGDGFKRLLNWTQRSGKPLVIPLDINDKVCEGTDFYGAIERAIGEFKGRQGRRGVVVLTDGEHARIPYRRENTRYVDSGDDRDFQRALRTVGNSDVVFYFVAVDTDLNPAPPAALRGYNPGEIYNMLQVRSRMEQLARESGGRVTFPKTPGDVVPLYEQIAQELGTSYGLGYTPSNAAKDGKTHRIEVRVRDKSLRVRQSRESYIAK